MSYLGDPAPTQFATSPFRVLHVDDQQEFAEITAEFVERENDEITVVTETTVQNGLDRLASEPIDCIVSDYEMPGRDGLEFLEQVREDHGDVPFILFTGRGSEEIASEAISAGVTDYLQKESGTDQYTVLANRIKNAVEHHRSRRAVEATEEKLLQLAERTDDILFLVDGDWDTLLFVNSAYEELWGGSITELRDDPTAFLDHIHPDDRKKAERSLERLQQGEADTIEYRVGTEAGEQRWVRGESKPIFDDDGNVSRIAGFVRDITDHKQQEQDLEWYKNLTEQVTGGISVVSEDGTIQYENAAFERLLGYDRSAREGTTVFEDMHPEDRQDVKQQFGTLIADDGPQIDRVQYRIRHADGSWRWLESEASARTAPALDGYVITSRDITEHKNRKRELEQHAAIVQNMADTAFIVGRNGSLEFANETALRYADKSLPEIKGSSIMELTHQMAVTNADAERFESVFETVTTGAEASTTDTAEVQLELPTGEVTAEYHLSAMQIDGEQKVVITGRDVTVRKRREETLRALHEVTREFMEASDQQSVADHAVTTAATTLDQPISCVWRYDGTEDALLPAAASDKGQNIITETPTFNQGEGLAWEVFDSGEARVYNDLHSEPERYNPDTPIKSEILLPLGEYGVMAISCTEQHRFTDIDVALARVLANTVEAALARADREMQLREQRRQLEQQNERLNEFAGVVSHDLRNPLRVAEGRLELAREECDTEHLDAIETALQRSDRIIEDVLWLAREGRDIGSMDSVELQAATDAAWELAADEAAQAELQYENGGRSLPPIVADEDRLRQLLENLLRNAIEHGGEDVTVTVGPLADGFYIEDTGPGIPETERDDVFVAGHSTSEEGTGFGLTIVKRVAEAHGWDINVTVGANGGARFEITAVEFVVE